jgi:hypothetical protein
MPTPRDEMWIAAASELSPDKSLAQIQDTGRFLVGSVAIVGTLLTGFGFVAGDAIRRASVGFSVALVLTLVSLTLALFALVIRTGQLRLNDLTAVERWYGQQLKWRGWAATLSGVALALALLTAGLTALTVATPEATIAATMKVHDSSSQPILSVQVRFEGMPRDSQAMFQVDGITASGSSSIISSGLATPTSNGTAELDADVATTSAYVRYVLTAAIHKDARNLASTSLTVTPP